MSTKDLNLSLEYDLADTGYRGDGPHDGVNRDAPATGRRFRGRQKAAAPRQKPAAGKVRKQPGASAWLTAAVALANMLFLLVAGIWLTGYKPQPAPPPTARVAPIAEAGLSDLRAKLDTVQQQLVSLRAAVEAQHRLLVASPPELADDVPAQAGAGQTAPAPTWQVNLGHVHAQQESIAMQRELQALGYTARVTAESRADGEGFSVQLTGFADRDAAELTAKDIMARTRFNGLWVSRSE